MKISFGGHEFMLYPAGVLFWVEKSMLIVTDLHLEKGSHFAQKGYFLPPYDTRETLHRLHEIIQALTPRQILILGDTFHDVGGYARLELEERRLFDALLPYKPLWITGNHDGDFVPQGFSAYKSFIMEGITFNHQAEEKAQNEISGHYHPKVNILHKKTRISRACFIEDGNKMILPAFGAYTGGLCVSNPSIARHFTNPRLYAIGNKVYALSK